MQMHIKPQRSRLMKINGLQHYVLKPDEIWSSGSKFPDRLFVAAVTVGQR